MADAPKPNQPTPSMADLLALIQAQGEQIAAMQKQAAAIVAPVVHARPKTALPDGPPWSIKVRAIRPGFYPNPDRGPNGETVRGMRHVRRFGRGEEHGGDEFFIEKAEDFAGGPNGWMELATQAPAKHVDPPPTTAAKPIQEPLMGAKSNPPGHPQRIIES